MFSSKEYVLDEYRISIRPSGKRYCVRNCLNKIRAKQTIKRHETILSTRPQNRLNPRFNLFCGLDTTTVGGVIGRVIEYCYHQLCASRSLFFVISRTSFDHNLLGTTLVPNTFFVVSEVPSRRFDKVRFPLETVVSKYRTRRNRRLPVKRRKRYISIRQNGADL